MPRLDGKGPQGKGPLTGRGLGNCEAPEVKVVKETEAPGRKLDGTGPNGQGPLTGRGLGNCEAPEVKVVEVAPEAPVVAPEAK